MRKNHLESPQPRADAPKKRKFDAVPPKYRALVLLVVAGFLAACNRDGNGTRVVVEPTAHSAPTPQVEGYLAEESKTPEAPIAAGEAAEQKVPLAPTPLPLAPRK